MHTSAANSLVDLPVPDFSTSSFQIGSSASGLYIGMNHYAPSGMGMQEAFQQLEHVYGQQQPAGLLRGRRTHSDDDNQSVGATSCNSQCSMTGKCTDAECANTSDACNDNNCPDLTLPPEVASGAVALMSINHNQEQPDPNFPSSTSSWFS